MCELKELDVVYVATPNPFHAEHAITALEHGKHVMVEKPMALTLEDCDRMIATAEKNHVKLMVAHTRSFNPPIRKMREIINSGQLGRVTQVHTIRYSPWLLRPREAAEINTDLGGGVCYRQAPHQVDIVRLLGGGLVRSVRAHAGRWSAENNTEGNYSALLEFDGGVTATLIYDGYGYFDDRELIEGDVFSGAKQTGPGQRLRIARAEGKLNKDTSAPGWPLKSSAVTAIPTGSRASLFSVLRSLVASAARFGSLRMEFSFTPSMAGMKCHVRSGTARLRWSWRISIRP